MPTDDVATAVSRIEAAGSSAPERAAIFASLLTNGLLLDRLAGLDNAERDAAFALIQGALKRAAKVDDLRAAVAEVLRGAGHAGAKRGRLFGLQMPAGYLLGKGGELVQQVVNDQGQVKTLLVAHRPIAITRYLLDREGEAVYVELTWGRGPRQPSESAIVPRSAAVDSRSLVSAIAGHAESGAPVHSRNAAAVVEYLAAQEAANAGQIPSAGLVRSMGWVGDVFVSGAEVQTDTGPVPVQSPGAPVALDRTGLLRDIAARVHRGGTRESYAAAIGPALRLPVCSLLICASLAPVLLACLPGQPSAGILDLAGPPGTGKTRALELIAGSVWGPGRLGAGPVVDANGSEAGLRDHRLAMGGLPWLLNETQHLIRYPELLAALPFQVYEGQSKILSARSGEVMRTVRSSAILCGNTALVDMADQVEGVRSRVLTCRSAPWGAHSQDTRRLILGLQAATLDHYGHLGPDFAALLLQHRDRWPDYRRAWVSRSAHWCEQVGPAAERAGFILAIYELAGLIVRRDLGLTALDVDAAMAEAVKAAQDSLSNADEPLRALRMIVSWAVSNAHQLDGNPAALPSGARIGRWDSQPGSDLSLLQGPLCDRMKLRGMVPETVLRHWRDRGWLIAEPSRRTMRKVVGGKLTPCYCIGAKGLDAAGARQEFTEAEIEHDREEAAR